MLAHLQQKFVAEARVYMVVAGAEETIGREMANRESIQPTNQARYLYFFSGQLGLFGQAAFHSISVPSDQATQG